MFELTGKKILIVGASSGIGAETVKVLAKQGAEVILVARREEKLKSLCEQIGEKACYYVSDITRIELIANLFETVVHEQGRLDGLAYVAGIASGDTPLRYLTYERQMTIFQTNYFGFVECVRQITKKGNYNPGLRIVAVSSVASLLGEKSLITYSASKAAMNSAIRCIAKELGEKGICINAVAPSMVRTEMYDSFVDVQGEESEANKKALSRQYLGLAKTTDVANAIVYLLSSEARFVTGITLPVDGGYSTT